MNPWHTRRWRLFKGGTPTLPEFVISSLLSNPATGITAGLVAAWNFETFAASKFPAAYPVDSAYDLAQSGTVAQGSGIVGFGLDTASAGYLNIIAAPVALLFSTNGSYSGCFWIRPTAASLSERLLDVIPVANTSGYGVDRPIFSDNIRMLCGNGSALEVVTASNTITSNAWNFIAFKRDNATGKIGISVSSTSSFNNLTLGNTASYAAPATPFIFASAPTARYDSLFLWNRALSDAEFQTIWNGGMGVSYPF